MSGPKKSKKPAHSAANPPALSHRLAPAMKAARERAKYTGRGDLTLLQERSGVDRSQLWRFEHGQALWPDIYSLWKLADVYHCSIDELVGRVSPAVNDRVENGKETSIEKKLKPMKK